ncbi:hypothetical protein GCM10023318_06040 [Nocardia callitridis]|uniref:Lipoprotein n=1 Tax=Nocardia callitridis TaxID=648753 RepID=A0ABP9JT85_9NOCA
MRAFHTGRPIGTVLGAIALSCQAVACTVNSVGPYRLCTAAVQNCRNAVTVAGGSASPATRTARSEAHSAEIAVPAKTESIEGTNEVMVTLCRPMISDR